MTFNDFWFCDVCYSDEELGKSNYKSVCLWFLWAEKLKHSDFFLSLCYSHQGRNPQTGLVLDSVQIFPSIQVSLCLLSSLTNGSWLSYLSSLLFNLKFFGLRIFSQAMYRGVCRFIVIKKKVIHLTQWYFIFITEIKSPVCGAAMVFHICLEDFIDVWNQVKI